MRICIDAGHYGKYNRSPAVPEYYESDMNWKLHLLLKKELEKYGFEVVTTRADKDKDLGLNARGKASRGCDLFLSLHSNAVGSSVNEDVDYVAVYHLYEDDGTDIDDRSKALALKLAPVISQVMGVKQSPNVCSRRGSGDWNGDGVLNDNYYSVLNGARLVGTPGLIIEHSFHTQTRATKWLMDDQNLEKLAKAEAEVIAEFYGMKQAKTPELGLPMLRQGNTGGTVRALQALLRGYGYALTVDGIFGPKTGNAVECFQEDNSLDADGIVGPLTWAALMGLE